MRRWIYRTTILVITTSAALLMLFTIAFSQTETVMGLLRDGVVHHESAAAAAVHALAAEGEHGHEDGAPHGPNHEHGTPADHCTHQHGNLFTPRSPDLAILGYTIPQVFIEPSLLFDRFSEPAFHPPQA